MRAARLAPLAAAALAVLSLAGCVRAGPDYPSDWPRLAWTWGCPDLRGQWWLGQAPGPGMGVFEDVPRMQLGDHEPVSWDNVSIWFDAERTMSVQLSRDPQRASNRTALLPASLRPYANRLDWKRPRPEHDGAKGLKWGLVGNQYQCNGHKLSFPAADSGNGTAVVHLAKDVQGNLVAELVDDPAKPGRHRWSHWPQATTSAREAAPGDKPVYDAGSAGTAAAWEVERGIDDNEKAEARFELEHGTKFIALVHVGRGALLASIEAPDEAAIRAALDNAASKRRYVVELWRYDPTHAGAVRADVLLTPHDPSVRMNMLLGIPDRPDSPVADTPAPVPTAAASVAPAPAPETPAAAREPAPAPAGPSIGEAQAAVLAAMPDSILFKNLATSPRGYRLQAHADNANAIVQLLDRLARNGHFVAYPATADKITLAPDGSFELDLTPRK